MTPNKFKDFDPKGIIGQVLGKLTVINYLGKGKYEHRYEVICECGEVEVAQRGSLLHGNKRRCVVCARAATKHPERSTKVGQKFGKLLVLKYLGKGNFVVQCDCGTIEQTALSTWKKACKECNRQGKTKYKKHIGILVKDYEKECQLVRAKQQKTEHKSTTPLKRSTLVARILSKERQGKLTSTQSQISGTTEQTLTESL